MAALLVLPKAAAPKATPQAENPTQTRGHPKKKLKKTSGVTPTPTYASMAASPPRPTAVVDMGGIEFVSTKPSTADVCDCINYALSSSPTHSQVHISAAKWTARGNLILTAGPRTDAPHLNAALDFISKSLGTLIRTDDPLPIRANVKWSRILLNRVPTGATDLTEAHSPDSCHSALAAENPSYASLTITQRPSWVKQPDSYQPGSLSSLSFAFEDPDGTLAASLLTNKTLYAFGTIAIVKKWKQRPPSKKPASPTPTPAGRTAPAQSTDPTQSLKALMPQGERRSRRQAQGRKEDN